MYKRDLCYIQVSRTFLLQLELIRLIVGRELPFYVRTKLPGEPDEPFKIRYNNIVDINAPFEMSLKNCNFDPQK